MRYWDSSAILAIVFDEPAAATLSVLFDLDPDIASSFITPLEIVSSIWRRRHAHPHLPDAHQSTDERFAYLSRRWFTTGDQRTLEIALRLVTRRPLRTGDAIQLATAIELATEHSLLLDFVTLDRNLAAAARAEGFAVLP